MALYDVNLTTHGITEGSIISENAPPYTVSQYTQAKANIDGINEAMDYAYNNGYEGILMPKGIYSLCGLRPVESPSYEERALFFPKDDQTINLGGATFEVIFDSDNRSPYDLAVSASPYTMIVLMFFIDQVSNVHITNGELKGDIYTRSFDVLNTNEKWVEGSQGIKTYVQSYNHKITNMDIHGFMGDGISGATTLFYPAVSYPIGKLIQGYISDDGTVIADEGSYYSDTMQTINFTLLESKTPKRPREVQLLGGGGYTRIPISSSPYWAIMFYNDADEYISRLSIKYLDRIIIPLTATKYKFQLIYEIDSNGDPLDVVERDYPDYLMNPVASYGLLISRCLIHDNHRGGISNLPDDTVVEDNQIFNNGMDSQIGAPLFPDATRYAINCEDSVSSRVIIRNNHIYNGLSALLLGCYTSVVEGNIISNFDGSGVNIYNATSSSIINNTFHNSGYFSLSESVEKRKVIFQDNIVLSPDIHPGFDVVSSNRDDMILLKNNYFEGGVGDITGKNIEFTGNRFKFAISEKDFSENAFFGVHVGICNNNIFDFSMYPNKSSVSYLKGGGNKYIGADASMNTASYSYLNDSGKCDLTYANDEFIDSKFKFAAKGGSNESQYLNFKNCIFNNTYISGPASYLQNDNIQRYNYITFTDCDITLDETSLTGCSEYVEQTSNFEYKLLRCNIKYINDTIKPKLFYNYTHKPYHVIMSKITVENNDDFLNTLT